MQQRIDRLVAILLICSLVLPAHLFASDDGAAPTAFLPTVIPPTVQKILQQQQPAARKSLAKVDDFARELEQAEEGERPSSIADPFHLTSQHLYIRNNEDFDRYHLSGIEDGLPRMVVSPDSIYVDIFAGQLAFGAAQALHVFANIKPLKIIHDSELVVVIDQERNIYVIDYYYAKRELFKSIVPVHKISLSLGEYELEQLQLSFIARGFEPFTHVKSAANSKTRVAAGSRFTAGDLVLWQRDGADKILLASIERAVLIAAVNSNNYLIGAIAYMIRADNPKNLHSALHERAGSIKFNEENTKEAAEFVNPKGKIGSALKVLQNADPRLLQKIVSNSIQQNDYLDQFTYTKWQRDYLIIKEQAQRTIKKLTKKVERSFLVNDKTSRLRLARLKEQLHKGDFSGSWIALSKEYLAELKELVVTRIVALQELNTPEANKKRQLLTEIMQQHDYKRLWENPQLLNDTERGAVSPFRIKIKRHLYKHLSKENLHNIATTILGLGGLGSAGFAAAWVVKGGFTFKDIIPDALRFRTFKNGATRRHLLLGMGIFVATIPLLAALGFLTAKASGYDWSFKKQLTLMGIRTDAFLSLPIWHHLANWTQQKTLLPALGAEISPFTQVSGASVIGKAIGLQPEEKLRVGFNSPYNTADSEYNNRRAIISLKEQRVRAQAIGWEIAARLLLDSDISEKLAVAGYSEAALLQTVNDPQFRRKWLMLAVLLEKEVFKLQQNGIYEDLRAVESETVHAFLRKTSPDILQVDYHESIFCKFNYLTKKTLSGVGKFFAEGGVDRINFLQNVDPDDFVSSFNWEAFWIDYVTIILWEAFKGARAKYSSNDPADIKALQAQKKFPYVHPQLQADLINQIAVRQVKDNGQLTLIFQLLKKIEEKNYTPIEEILHAGKDGEEQFFQEVLNYGKNAFDLRNVDYGGNFMGALIAMVTTLQATVLLTLVTRRVFSKTPIKIIIPQIVFLLTWRMWAFSFPWIMLASTSKLRDNKLALRNTLFTRTKVNLQRALDSDDMQAIKTEHNNLLAIYSNYGTALPFAKAANDADFRVADARELLEFSLAKPPFSKSSNGVVDKTFLWGGSDSYYSTGQ